MRVLIRAHLTYANVMSTLAVFLVLAGGTALAAGLPRNSVGSATVKDNSLTSADLADGRGVGGADIADGSLAGIDLAAGSIGSAQIGNGEVGPEALAPDAVDSSSVLDKSLRGADFDAGVLSGENIAINTLGRVPAAETLSFHRPSSMIGTNIYEREIGPRLGTQLPDKTFEQTARCEEPNDLLLSGGASSVIASAEVYESAPFGEPLRQDVGWRVRVGNIQGDLWSIRIICARPLNP